MDFYSLRVNVEQEILMILGRDDYDEFLYNMLSPENVPVPSRRLRVGMGALCSIDHHQW